jgi:putative FmdB family regulatory protein
MPIYEYECPTHGRYEVSQRITEAALSSCTQPDCSQPVRKLISSTSFALKGGGWYSDGYGSSSGSSSSASGGGKSEASAAAGCGAAACGTGACAAKAEA